MHHLLWKSAGIVARLVWEMNGGKEFSRDLRNKIVKTVESKATEFNAPKRVTLKELDFETIRVMDEELAKEPNFTYYVQRGIAKSKTGNPLGAREDFAKAREMDSIRFDELIRKRVPGVTAG